MILLAEQLAPARQGSTSYVAGRWRPAVSRLVCQKSGRCRDGSGGRAESTWRRAGLAIQARALCALQEPAVGTARPPAPPPPRMPLLARTGTARVDRRPTGSRLLQSPGTPRAMTCAVGQPVHRSPAATGGRCHHPPAASAALPRRHRADDDRTATPTSSRRPGRDGFPLTPAAASYVVAKATNTLAPHELAPPSPPTNTNSNTLTPAVRLRPPPVTPRSRPIFSRCGLRG